MALLEAGVEAVEGAVEEAAAELEATGEDASLEEVAEGLRDAVDEDAVPQDEVQLAGIE